MQVVSYQQIIPLVKTAVWYGTEDTNNDERKNEGTENGLQENGVLDLAKGGLLDPDFAIKHLADEIALLVLGNPRLILVTVAGVLSSKSLHRVGFEVEAFGFVVRGEQFPGSQMSVMHAVKNNAHSLPGSDESRNTDEETDEGEDAPGSTGAAESDEDSCNKTTYNSTDTEASSKDDTGTVAIADSPANEVGMSLTAQRPLDRVSNTTKGGGVSGVLKGVQQIGALPGREVELASTTVGNIDGYDAGNLLAVRLNGD